MLVCFAPSRMTAKISPSLWPCFHAASVRSDGFGLRAAADLPSPLPDSPWQEAQFDVNSFRPAVIDAWSEGTGFFNVTSSPGCARPGAPASTIAAKTTPDRIPGTLFRTFRRVDSLKFDLLSN